MDDYKTVFSKHNRTITPMSLNWLKEHAQKLGVLRATWQVRQIAKFGIQLRDADSSKKDAGYSINCGSSNAYSYMLTYTPTNSSHSHVNVHAYIHANYTHTHAKVEHFSDHFYTFSLN